MDDVLPIRIGSDDQNIQLSSDENEEDHDPAHETGAPILDDALKVKTIHIKGTWAGWQDHTSGFGGKMLAKMGYIIGQGLGLRCQGRIEPVEITVLPPGAHTLDQIAELRKTGKIKKPSKEKKKGTKLVDDKKQFVYKKYGNTEAAFDLINKLSEKRKARETAVQKMKSAAAEAAKFSVEESYKQMKSRDRQKGKGDVRTKQNVDKSVNVQMAQIYQKQQAAKQKISKLHESLKRNSTDASLRSRLEYNIQVAEQELQMLANSESNLQHKIDQKKGTKKLSIF